MGRYSIEDDIEDFLNGQLMQGCGSLDLDNQTVFNFHNIKDLKAFTREMQPRIPTVRVNVNLNGDEYLADNIHSVYAEKVLEFR